MLIEGVCMDMRKNTALVLLIAINLMTIVRHFVSFGTWEIVPWLALAVPFFLFPRARPQVTTRTQEAIIIYTLLFVGLYLTIWWVTGYIDSFGRSPYARTAMGLIHNIGLFGGVIVAQELVRAFIASSGERNKKYMAIFVAVTFILYHLKISTFIASFSSVSTLVPYVGGTLLPTIIQSIMLTWLTWTAGPIPALLYRFIPELIQWALPTLPKIGWLIKMMLGIVVPVFTLLALQQVATPRLPNKRAKKNRNYNQSNPVVWILFLAILSSMFAFTLGLLPYKPMVIATNSMLPAIRSGDVVIMRSADTSTLEVGDIMAYRLEGYNIVHRVAAVNMYPDGNRFILKGDNNSDPDALEVAGEQILGEVIYVVPYVGLLSLAIKAIDTPQNVPVETGSD